MDEKGKGNFKQVLISIAVGACVAFLTTLFEGLAEYLKTHSVEVVSGISSSMVYLAKTFRG
jgi:hypothetical protein